MFENLEKFGKIYAFVDFGNVNKWFDKDVWGINGEKLAPNQKLIVDIKKLGDFVDRFSLKKFFYYGLDTRSRRSLHVKLVARRSRFRIITKPIQWIKRRINGKSDLTAKCNFDVEICLDIVRLLHYYDSVCLFSSDNDFALLLDYLRKNNKKIILISHQPVRRSLREKATIFVSASGIKRSICKKKDLAVARSGNRTRILEQGSKNYNATIAKIQKKSS